MAKAKAKARKPPGAFKVCVCGGAGGIGQPLSMFMALDPNVKELSVDPSGNAAETWPDS